VRRRWNIECLLGLLLLGTSAAPAFAGDSLYGLVTGVQSASVVIFEAGEDRYEVRLIGIDAPKAGPVAEAGRKLLADLVLGKSARMRFEGRAASGEMVSRLFTDDPVLGIKDLGLELVKAGLAARQKGFDYKYGELSTAENEARSARRGLWAAATPQ